MNGGWRLRRVRAGDATAVASIYRPYVERTRFTFELEAPSEQEIARRIADAEGRLPYLVAVDIAENVIGYAYAARFRERPAYRFAVETTIYLAPAAQGQGVGYALYTQLLALLTAQRFVHAIGVVTLPNERSVALHERTGFTPCGSYPGIGYKLGEWATVALYHRLLRPLADVPEEPLRLSACAAWAAMDP